MLIYGRGREQKENNFVIIYSKGLIYHWLRLSSRLFLKHAIYIERYANEAFRLRGLYMMCISNDASLLRRRDTVKGSFIKMPRTILVSRNVPSPPWLPFPLVRGHWRLSPRMCVVYPRRSISTSAASFHMKQTAAPNTGFSVIARRTAAPYQEELCAGYAGRFLFESVPNPKLTRNTVYYAPVLSNRVIARMALEFQLCVTYSFYHL